MSYTPTEWKKGDIVTSEKLNKLETGVADAGGGGGGALICEDTSGTLNKTAGEIVEAIMAGIPVYTHGGFYAQFVYVTYPPNTQTYGFGYFAPTGPQQATFFQYTALTADDYPTQS